MPTGRRDGRGAEPDDDALDDEPLPTAHEEEVRRLIGALRREHDRCHEQQPPCRPDLSLETLAELLVLLTALHPLLGSRPPAPSRIDEHIEDMIDPEFGLRPARTIITQAAEQILRGQPGLEWPRRRARPGRLLDTDED